MKQNKNKPLRGSGHIPQGFPSSCPQKHPPVAARWVRGTEKGGTQLERPQSCARCSCRCRLASHYLSPGNKGNTHNSPSKPWPWTDRYQGCRGKASCPFLDPAQRAGSSTDCVTRQKKRKLNTV